MVQFISYGFKEMEITQVAANSKVASIHLAAAKSDIKNQALKNIAKSIKANTEKIIAANKIDLTNANKNNLPKPLLKRLTFDTKKIYEVSQGLESLINLPDPVGRTLTATQLDNNLNLYKVTCPIGLIGVIFESRPDALVQISSLCLKSGNTVLLKGGSEAVNTNRILADLITKATTQTGIPKNWLGLLETRADVAQMLILDKYIDLLIPRGSNEFVQHIMNNTNIPVLGHADGICQVYIDKNADIDMAVAVTVDSKCQYTAVCNAAETLLVHREVANNLLPKLCTALNLKDVQIRGCEKTAQIIDVKPAGVTDWQTEYLDSILSIKIVDSIDDAIDHINKFGSGHTDSIITQNKSAAAKFMDLIDSANVFYNCSTRFSDGYRYGLGAEVGISTNKIHARGPVGLEGLLIYKWRLIGDGHIVSDYSGPQAKKFTHKKIDKEYNL